TSAPANAEEPVVAHASAERTQAARPASASATSTVSTDRFDTPIPGSSAPAEQISTGESPENRSEDKPTEIASLPDREESASESGRIQEDTPEELYEHVQRELIRVGCMRGEADGIWGPLSSDALKRFTD